MIDRTDTDTDDDFLGPDVEGDCRNCEGTGETVCNAPGCEGSGCSRCSDGMKTCPACDGSGFTPTEDDDDER